MPIGVKGYIIDYGARVRGFNAYGSGRDFVEFLYYEDIEGGVEPVYEEQSVRGRSEEHIFYSHTGAQADSFTIRLPSSVDGGDSGSHLKTWQDFLFIKSFVYPDYGENNQGPILPPRKAILKIGNWYQHVGVIKGFSYTFSKVCDAQGYPHIIDVRFQFRVVNARALSLQQIRAQSG